MHPTPNWQEAVRTIEDGEELHLILSKLPPVYAEALRLRYLDGYSVKEMAQISGVSEDAVYKRLQRGCDQALGLVRRSRAARGRDGGVVQGEVVRDNHGDDPPKGLRVQGSADRNRIYEVPGAVIEMRLSLRNSLRPWEGHVLLGQYICGASSVNGSGSGECEIRDTAMSALIESGELRMLVFSLEIPHSEPFVVEIARPDQKPVRLYWD
jgi:hypothetical protein